MIYVVNEGERIFPELQSSPSTSIFIYRECTSIFGKDLSIQVYTSRGTLRTVQTWSKPTSEISVEFNQNPRSQYFQIRVNTVVRKHNIFHTKYNMDRFMFCTKTVRNMVVRECNRISYKNQIYSCSAPMQSRNYHNYIR